MRCWYKLGSDKLGCVGWLLHTSKCLWSYSKLYVNSNHQDEEQLETEIAIEY